MELGEPDASGRRRPIPKEGSNFVLDVDTVIMSIGTSPNPLIRSTTTGLEANKHGCLVADEKGAKRALAALLCRLGRRGYEKARARMPEADEEIRQALEDLRCLEAERCPSMDRAADTSSRMTAAVVPRTGDTRERILHQMFYQIGRWIYLVDAVQDIQKDMEENSYNPVVLRYELQTPDISAVREPLERTLERSLADICMAFDLLSPRRDADLIRNIIFLGMPTVTRQVLNGTYQTNEGRGKHGSL